MANDTPSFFRFIWVVTAAHFIAYFIAGIFALYFLDYENLFATPELSVLMRPVSSPIVILGPFLQLLRGVLLGLILFPIYRVIIDGKYGIWKLGWLIIGLCLLSTIGPTSGSFDGFIYTNIPIRYQLAGYFEAVVYVVLFCVLIRVAYRYDKKWIHILYLLFMLITSALLLFGFFNAIR